MAEQQIRPDVDMTKSAEATRVQLPILVTGEYGRQGRISAVADGLEDYIFSDETRIVRRHEPAVGSHPLDRTYTDSANIYNQILCNRRSYPNYPEATVVVGGRLRPASRNTVAFLGNLAGLTKDPVIYSGRSLGTTMLDSRIKVVNDPKEILEIIRAHERGEK